MALPDALARVLASGGCAGPDGGTRYRFDRADRNLRDCWSRRRADSRDWSSKRLDAGAWIPKHVRCGGCKRDAKSACEYEYRNARRHRSSERFGWSARLDDWERLLQQDVRTARSHVTTDYERFVAESVAAIKETPRVDFPLSHVLALPELRHAGLWLEFGVFRGRSLKMLAAAKGDAKVFGFDTFQGLPEDWKPGIPKGSFSVGGRLPDVPGAEFVVGLFEDTLPTFRFEAPVTLAHIDCDIGSAAQTALKAIRPHLADVSHIVFDELWNYAGFADHEMKALYDQLDARVRDRVLGAQQRRAGCLPRHSPEGTNVELYDAAFYADNVKSRQTYASSLAKYHRQNHWAEKKHIEELDADVVYSSPNCNCVDIMSTGSMDQRPLLRSGASEIRCQLAQVDLSRSGMSANGSSLVANLPGDATMQVSRGYLHRGRRASYRRRLQTVSLGT